MKKPKITNEGYNKSMLAARNKRAAAKQFMKETGIKSHWLKNIHEYFRDPENDLLTLNNY